MATSNFHARLERIEKAQAGVPASKSAHFRTPGIAGVAAIKRGKLRKRNPLKDHVLSLAIGVVMGALMTVGFIGLSQETSFWGPGTTLNDYVYYPIMAGLALSPVFLIAALIFASRKPGFAIYALGYVTGIVIPLFT